MPPFLHISLDSHTFTCYSPGRRQKKEKAVTCWRGSTASQRRSWTAHRFGESQGDKERKKMKGGSAALWSQNGKRRRDVHHQPLEARRTVNIINLAAAQLRMLCGFQGHLATQTTDRTAPGGPLLRLASAYGLHTRGLHEGPLKKGANTRHRCV